MKIDKVCVLGGSGFLGTYLVSKLSARGTQVRVISRHPERQRDLLVLPNVEVVEADVHDINRLSFYLHDVDAVINLVGILNDNTHDGSGFRHCHVELPKKIVQACQKNNITRLLHMSALNADQGTAPSHYLRTKGEGENHLHIYSQEGLLVTSFRPSVIFGPGDSFFNRFAKLLKMIPWIYPVPRPDCKFAPVYVGDVANCMVEALFDASTAGQRIDLCGPREYSMKELLEFTADVVGAKRRFVRLPDSLSRFIATVSDFSSAIPLITPMMNWLIPGMQEMRFSMDNYRSMLVDSVCHDGMKMPTAIEDIVPQYLGAKHNQSRYNTHRIHARRS